MAGTFTFFVHLRATREWLALSRRERKAFVEGTLHALFAAHPKVGVRWYDAEAFTGKCSDIAVFETDDLREYYFLMDGIRDSKVFTVPYFEFLEIIPAVENGYEEYEQSLS